MTLLRNMHVALLALAGWAAAVRPLGLAQRPDSAGPKRGRICSPDCEYDSPPPVSVVTEAVTKFRFISKTILVRHKAYLQHLTGSG